MEYNIRVYKPELKKEEGKINNLKGFATITFDEAFCVKSLAIKESSKGNLYLDIIFHIVISFSTLLFITELLSGMEDFWFPPALPHTPPGP